MRNTTLKVKTDLLLTKMQGLKSEIEQAHATAVIDAQTADKNYKAALVQHEKDAKAWRKKFDDLIKKDALTFVTFDTTVTSGSYLNGNVKVDTKAILDVIGACPDVPRPGRKPQALDRSHTYKSLLDFIGLLEISAEVSTTVRMWEWEQFTNSDLIPNLVSNQFAH